jgi:23S rRNA (adenine2503-C2)-methyltransferase
VQGTRDGLTHKFVVALADGARVESVSMRTEKRLTFCASSQVGCALKCTFCATGLMGLKRNLTAGEIVEQVLHVKRGLPGEERITSVVIMGIGEPLLNPGNLIKALRIWKAPWGMGIGYHRITLSTVGILDKLQTLVDAGTPPNLALSLHAPNDKIRAEIVPTMKKWSVSDIVKAGIEYKKVTKKEVTFEYVLIDGVNDDRKHALELGKKVRGTRCKVNVIPFNRVEEVPYREPSQARIDRFVNALGGCGVPVMVRKRKGDAISAACGQLRAVTERSAAVAGHPVKIPSGLEE